MRYQLIAPLEHRYTSALEQILHNRGVKDADFEHYLNTTDEDINDFNLFPADQLNAAAKAIVRNVASNNEAKIVVDSDCDGFTSAALMINYLHDLFPAWVENKLTYFIHSGKQHGLSDYPDVGNEKLIIVPDAGSNDYIDHVALLGMGIDVVILDHHEAEEVTPAAAIINNQLCDYPNKFLSGVGVVWQFCRYLDNMLGNNFANNYLDLVALGNMADMMSLLNLETKHLINKGFEDKNIKNPFIYYISQKHSYSLGDTITPMGAAFYIAPYVNAIVRSGTQEEKELVFKSMLKFKASEKIPSTKRGHKPGDMETIVEQAMRIITNVKNRQTKAQDKGLEALEKYIEENHALDNKVLLIKENGLIDRNIAGLIANKFMAKYQRPVCLLTKVDTEEGITWQGSARGCDKRGINNFKDICAETGCIMYAEG